MEGEYGCMHKCPPWPIANNCLCLRIQWLSLFLENLRRYSCWFNFNLFALLCASASGNNTDLLCFSSGSFSCSMGCMSTEILHGSLTQGKRMTPWKTRKQRCRLFLCVFVESKDISFSFTLKSNNLDEKAGLCCVYLRRLKNKCICAFNCVCACVLLLTSVCMCIECICWITVGEAG